MSHLNFIKLSIILFAIIILSTLAVPRTVLAQDVSIVRGSIIVDRPRSVSTEAERPDYIFTELTDEEFLRSDGSAVLYIGNRIRNDDAEPLQDQTWCFYWGEDVYQNIYARDETGFLDVDYYEHYSEEYGLSGMCAETTFRTAIQNGSTYWYAVSITINEHHAVENDTINAYWRVQSSSKVESYRAKVSWPYNHNGVEADPEPDELTSSYALWNRTSNDAPWEFTVDLSIRLGNQMAVTPLSQGTSPYDGVDNSWEDDPYGVNTSHNIGEWGCYLTSAAMAINYFAQLLGFYDQIDPGNLNTWLSVPNAGNSQPRGYGRLAGDGPGVYSGVVSGVLDDASENLLGATGAVIIPGAQENVVGISDMRDNLQNGQLGLLNVLNGGYGHWVLVTGYETENGIDTVTINDPWQSRGSTTLQAQYNNRHLNNVRWFSIGNQTTRPNYVTLYANCPVELLVTDERGRRTGYDARTGTAYDDIPSSVYVTQYFPQHEVATSEGTKVLQIESYEPSVYNIEIIGTGYGEYVVKYVAELSSGETDVATFSGATTAGKIDKFQIIYDPNSGFQRFIFLPLMRR